MFRRFLPVGQGAFYCEQFDDLFNTARINVVYDCGSMTDVKLVEKQIKNNFTHNEVIQALFISHLDEDHINGIPFLLKYCNVKKIFFPLITQSNKDYMKLYNLIEYKERELFAYSFIDNPEAALRQLNLENIPTLYQISENSQEDNRTNQIIIPSGEDIRDYIFGNAITDEEMYKEWVYVPYNFRQKDRIKQLKHELNTIFGKKMDNEDLEKLWKSGTDADKENIKKAYRGVKGSFNTNSMILYSGTEKAICGIINNGCLYEGCCYNCRIGRSGCLYMGDYDAAGDHKWKDLRNAYNKYWDNIGCIQIPHHGSKHNYNTKLSEQNAYYVISAGINNKWNHPHGSVIKDLLFNGKYPYIITENESSELDLEVILL